MDDKNNYDRENEVLSTGKISKFQHGPYAIIFSAAVIVFSCFLVSGTLYMADDKSIIYYSGGSSSSEVQPDNSDEDSSDSSSDISDGNTVPVKDSVSDTASKSTDAPEDSLSDTSSENVYSAEAAEAMIHLPESEAVFPLDINIATKQQLMLINGIGEKTASDIISFREQRGVITSIEQLSEISGIGEAKVRLLSQYLYVSDDVYVPYSGESAETTETAASKVSYQETYVTDPITTETEAQVHSGLKIEPYDVPVPATETDAQEHERTPVDINRASAEEIAACLLLPIEKAEDIIAVREQIYYFSNAAELYLVESLTPREIMDITDYVIIKPL